LQYSAVDVAMQHKGGFVFSRATVADNKPGLRGGIHHAQSTA